jgi:hypothetical protein
VAKRIGVPAEGDRVAVDDAGDYRRELARERGHQGFVHEPQAFFDPPLLDEGAALLVPREPHEVGIAEPPGDLGINT